MIVRASAASRHLVSAAVLALLVGSYGIQAAPVVVANYDGLVGTIGSQNNYDTGERFTREGLVLIHKGTTCQPDFDKHGLAGFDNFPDMFTLISVDVDHADEDLLHKLEVNPAELSDAAQCPAMTVVPRRSPVESPQVRRLRTDARGTYHLPAVKSQQVSVGIVNEMGFDLDIHYQFWEDTVRPTHIRTLAPTMENWMITYKTTTLFAKNKDTQEVVATYLVTGHSLFTVAERSCSAETCGNSEGTEMPSGKTVAVARASREKEDLPQDARSVAARKQHDAGRLANNRRQPEGLPRFTEVGFKKMRVPDDVWDVVKTYYEENKSAPKKEKWGANNVFTNNIEAPSYMVNLPENGVVKEKIFEGLKPILEEWSGVELVQTACYGIRVYTDTSWLANHVDTRATHAVSVIMQVDQDVDEDWPLMIYDHAGNDYNITMKPRDLVLYESATCVHGRPSTLHGNFYANAFVHYKPTDPKEWSDYL